MWLLGPTGKHSNPSLEAPDIGPSDTGAAAAQAGLAAVLLFGAGTIICHTNININNQYLYIQTCLHHLNYMIYLYIYTDTHTHMYTDVHQGVVETALAAPTEGGASSSSGHFEDLFRLDGGPQVGEAVLLQALHEVHLGGLAQIERERERERDIYIYVYR